MSGAIGYYVSNSSKNFREWVDAVNEDLLNYGISPYEPDFNLYDKYEQGKVVLPGYHDLPGMDLYTSKKAIIRRLKTIALEFEYDPSWTPDNDALFIGQPIIYELVEEVFQGKRPHFITHVLHCGYYVPVDFGDVQLPYWDLQTLGSSFSLFHELEEVARKLNFDLGEYTPNFINLHERMIEEFFDEPLYNEKLVLLELYNITLGSIKNNIAIVFS